MGVERQSDGVEMSRMRRNAKVWHGDEMMGRAAEQTGVDSNSIRTAVSARRGSGLAMRQLAKRSNSTDNTGLDMAKSRGD